MNSNIKVKKKTVYGLKTRLSDADEWSEPVFYKSQKKRDNTASLNRIIGGIRTYSFNERKTIEEIEELDF